MEKNSLTKPALNKKHFNCNNQHINTTTTTRIKSKLHTNYYKL